MVDRRQVLLALAFLCSSSGWLFAAFDVRYVLRSLTGHIAYVGFALKKRTYALDLAKDVCEERAQVFLGRQDVVYHSSVKTHDVDLFKHLSNSKYLKEGDFARFKLVNVCGLWEASYNLGIPIVVAQSTIRHRKELPMFKPFKIVSRVVGYDEVSVFVEHRFVSKSAKTKQEDLNALLFVRMQLTNKGKMQRIFEYLGIENMMPATSSPPNDVLAWNYATTMANDRIKRGYSGKDDGGGGSALSAASPYLRKPNSSDSSAEKKDGGNGGTAVRVSSKL